ncbi:lipopolysaccharide-induced tumor necrosis factor-alpha factor homolog isoform X2 [Limulus polyphemus]|uniref:Lipopolysaccharide-induced tumor necrosis factor-alpha factor homolog isoform X2 n=1 Tax=Limulus polyphemus TaxID=6850 RepID=A0ABM1S2G5_LIMPO|nr:lipopolysaccharide-induced tumor necrosis factor-alpha factor homolog isoform X2 [Limulus polyphemus]XP_022237821.1 lipopolysaccharide-induced tumor necrosis factor-alpha factor homolog isoform X2 [Limulus polyphemus]XP_022237822.1 lipopolysaccharide-induced tumor necrosis factor-alpha factor homolog isoform X2 [Limulus polyphemus]
MDPQKPSGPYAEPPPPYSSAPPPSNYNPPPGVFDKGAGSAPFPTYSHHAPPPGGVPVFPMTAGYPPKSSTVVVGAPHAGPGLTSVTVVNMAQWGPYPMQMTCPHCAAQVMTETTASPGLLTWILSGSLIFLGCWLGCCLIPCCIPECQDIEHRCPNCKHHLGSYRRL